MKKDWFSVMSNLFLFIVFYFFVGGILYVFGVGVSGLSLSDFRSESKIETYHHFVISCFDLLAITFLTFIFLRREGYSFSVLGFKFSFNQMLQAFVLGGIFIALFFVGFLIFDLIEIRKAVFNSKELIFITLFLFVAALCEELIFRGYMMTMMRKYVGNFWGILISSFVFALFHIFNPNLSVIGMLELFLAGIALGYVYFKTRNIWFVTVMHFSWNYLQTLLGFNVSGQDFYSLIDFTYLKENIITGGKFGFEGSIFSLLVEVLTVIIIFNYNSKKLQLS